MFAFPDKSKRKFVLAGLLFLACILWFVVARGHDEFLGADSQATKKAILNRVPLGSPISTAQSVMAAQGFTCVKRVNTKFAEDRPEGGQQLVLPPADFLYCDSGKRGFIVTKRWQVAFVETSGSVSYIAVSVGLTGP